MRKWFDAHHLIESCQTGRPVNSPKNKKISGYVLDLHDAASSDRRLLKSMRRSHRPPRYVLRTQVRVCVRTYVRWCIISYTTMNMYDMYASCHLGISVLSVFCVWHWWDCNHSIRGRHPHPGRSIVLYVSFCCEYTYISSKHESSYRMYHSISISIYLCICAYIQYACISSSHFLLCQPAQQRLTKRTCVCVHVMSHWEYCGTPVPCFRIHATSAVCCCSLHPEWHDPCVISLLSIITRQHPCPIHLGYKYFPASKDITINISCYTHSTPGYEYFLSPQNVTCIATCILPYSHVR